MNLNLKNKIKYFYIVLNFQVFFSIIFLDILSVKYAWLGKIGTYFWFCSYIFFFIFILKVIFYIFRSTSYSEDGNIEKKTNITLPGKIYSKFYLLKIFLKNKPLITFFTIIIWIIVLFSNISSINNISGETCIEVRDTINHLKNSEDLGFRGTVICGYPARQIFLPSIPTLILNRNIFALNLGGSLYFLMGLIIFSSGILKNFEDTRSGDLICGIILSLIFHIYYVNFFILAFQQSIYPFSFGLIICGLFLNYIKNRTFEIIFLIGFSLLYLIFTYTTGLALFFLSIVVLIFLCFKIPVKLKKQILILFIIISALTAFYLSLSIRSDLRLTGHHESITIKQAMHKTSEVFNNIFYNKEPQVDTSLKIDEVKSKIFKAADHIFYNTEATPMFSTSSGFIFLFTIFASLFFYGWEMSVLSLWVIGTIIISVIAKGFDVYPLDFTLHKSIVIFPVIFVMLLKIIKSTKIDYKKSYYTFFIIFTFLLITGLHNQSRYIKVKFYQNEATIRHGTIILWLKENILEEHLTCKAITCNTIKKMTGKMNTGGLIPLKDKELPPSILKEKLKQLKYSEEDINQIFKYIQEVPKKTNLYFTEDLKNHYISLNDSLGYLNPYMKSSILDANYSQLFESPSKEIYLLVKEDNIKVINEYIKNEARILSVQYMGIFSFRGDDPLILYKIYQEERQKTSR